MKFDRQDLVARLGKYIAGIEAENTVAQKNADDKHVEARVNWIATEKPRLEALAAFITQRLDVSGILTTEDVDAFNKANPAPGDRGWYNGALRAWGISLWPTDPPQPHLRDVSELKAVLALLTKMQDETVTTNALKTIGLKDVLFLFRTNDAGAE